ncbi:2996_t:CDS:2 [Ambispora gerdemannii]|uniref:2996_t:CDS:1 n=1 Tax=Ambispora gerdemannii TaxID=144530 RepID=A0A9N8W0K1_9GLOM|nr:2996_t:CDS:2 [Ambispora gerdemannii]
MGGGDIFPDLITDSNGRRFLKMDVPPHSAGSGSCPYKSGVKMPKGVQYEYRVRIMNGRDGFNLTAKDEECYAFIIQQGAVFTLQTIGTFEIERIVGDPPGMPNDNILPATGVDPAQRPTNPFRTNNIGDPNSNLRTVGGIDIDTSQDPDPTQDPDKPTDPDLPPDISPDDPPDDPD